MKTSQVSLKAGLLFAGAALVVMLTTVSCASVTDLEPVSPQDSLVIARAEVRHPSDVQVVGAMLELANDETGEIVRLHLEDRFFMGFGLSPGTWRASDLIIEITMEWTGSGFRTRENPNRERFSATRQYIIDQPYIIEGEAEPWRNWVSCPSRRIHPW